MTEQKKNIRLKTLQRQRLEPQEITVAYTQWVSEDEYIVFNEGDDYWASKASKRGNDVYISRVNDKFKDMKRNVKDDGVSLYGSVQETKSDLLFITLTTRQDESIFEAWKNIGKKLDVFRANLISKFKKIEFMRTFESHDNGYPHIHMLIKFLDSDFDVFKGMKNGKQHWLVRKNYEIKKCWKHGFVDVSGCTSSKEALSYIGKYIMKSATSNAKDNLTQALNWYYGKRAFSVSRHFFSVLLKGVSNSSRIPNPDVIFLGVYPRHFVYGFILHDDSPYYRGAWDISLSLNIIDHLSKIDEIFVNRFNKENNIHNEYDGSYGLNGLRKAENFLEIAPLNDYGTDMEVTEIEANNSTHTQKEKLILADMELDTWNFVFFPSWKCGEKKKITEIMVKMGQAKGKIMLIEALNGKSHSFSNCKSTHS